MFKQEKIVLQLTHNPGLTLTGSRTTRPWAMSVDQFEEAKEVYQKWKYSNERTSESCRKVGFMNHVKRRS